MGWKRIMPHGFTRRASKTIYFRRGVPRSLQKGLGKSEWCENLQTSDLVEAAIKIEALRRETDSVIAAEKDRTVAVERHRRRFETANEALRSAPTHVKELVTEYGGVEGLDTRMRQLAHGKAILEAGVAISTEYRIPEINGDPTVKGDPQNARLVRAFNHEISEAQNARKLIDDELLEGATAIVALGLDSDSKSKAIASKAQPGLLEAFEYWAKTTGATASYRRKTRKSCEMFISLHGNIPLRNIDKSTFISFRDAYQDLPKLAPHSEHSERGMQELLSLCHEYPEIERIGTATIKNGVDGVRRVLNHAASHDWIALSPCTGVQSVTKGTAKSRKSKEEKNKRTPFSRKELVMIRDFFVADRYRTRSKSHGDENLYIVLLAIFQGARIEEIAQLRPEDIDLTRMTIWISDDADFQSIKNENSRRLLPIHPGLQEAGFPAYVASRANKPLLFGDHERTLALDRQKDEATIGAKFSERILRRIRDKVGINTKNHVFHSFRHSWEDLGREAIIDGTTRAQLGGRQKDDDPTQSGYGRGVSMAAKRVASAKIDPFGEGPYDPMLIDGDRDVT